ncbi:MAG TPA: UvrB/UvrC motif-containing protein [Candidatus Omnitrophota bacterium]|jgi:protein arginine kinase activator|nr:MAG: UvrB/uvrC motif protein [Candidatus Omnitrophica bacterium ADurb.Bin314]HOE68066.1 UvrB/UvrC motif-containing protein [Candidatus Omnitrophota bacterium]HQB94339.1 UvrB/UvrC motif-containing protein [Candidatus Omnitrophota bacterium]
MICNVCGTKEATIHLTEVVSGQMAEVHICEQCAEEKGTDFKTYFNFGDFFTGFAGIGKLLETPGEKTAVACKSCGMTFEEFSKQGRLGCAQCYTAFHRQLEAVIKQVQRAGVHVGKKPSRIPKDVRRAHDLRQLQDRLRKCIQNEAFEEAARLRDEIRQIEDKNKRPRKTKND